MYLLAISTYIYSRSCCLISSKRNILSIFWLLPLPGHSFFPSEPSYKEYVWAKYISIPVHLFLQPFLHFLLYSHFLEFLLLHFYRSLDFPTMKNCYLNGPHFGIRRLKLSIYLLIIVITHFFIAILDYLIVDFTTGLFKRLNYKKRSNFRMSR